MVSHDIANSPIGAITRCGRLPDRAGLIGLQATVVELIAPSTPARPWSGWPTTRTAPGPAVPAAGGPTAAADNRTRRRVWAMFLRPAVEGLPECGRPVRMSGAPACGRAVRTPAKPTGPASSSLPVPTREVTLS